MKCDLCSQPGIALVGEANERIVCGDHAAEVQRLDWIGRAVADDHCHGLVARDGFEDACGKPPTTVIDDPDGGPWPACTWHAHRYGGSRVLTLREMREALR